MTFDRDDEDHFDQEYDDELDQQFRAGRQAESDDFASFDASRYLRNRTGKRSQGIGDVMDEEPEELAVDRRSGRRRTRTDDLPSVRSGRRTSAAGRPLTRQGRSSLLNSAVKTDRRGSGFWTLITAMMFEPGLRTILMAAGCFFLLAMVGCCGLIYVAFFRR